MRPELRSEVFSILDSLVTSTSPPHRNLLQLHIAESRSDILSKETFAPVDLPVLVHDALQPGARPPIALAAACTLVYLGADLLDNAMDDELSGVWANEGPNAAVLAATTYLSSLAFLAIDRQAASSSQRVNLTTAMASALRAMSAGQYLDIGNHAIDAEGSVTTAELKAGAEFGLFMKTAAIVAGATQPVPDRFDAIGIAAGTAAQLASDVHDTFHLDPSPDLLNGRATLPVTHALSVLRGGELHQLREVLQQCRDDPSAHGRARALLLRSGGLRMAAIAVQVKVQRATRLIRELGLAEEATSKLGECIGSLSMLRFGKAPVEQLR